MDNRFSPRHRLLVGAALLLVAGCGRAGSPGVEVQPFSEVQASEFSFEADPTHHARGIFRVTTTEEMICAIVWGEGEELGRFNNSLNMAGTGIVEHDVFLPGAEPGVEYRFVVQGTTSDGTLYRSEMGSFVIPESGVGAPEGDGRANLALGVAVEASSEFSGAFAAVHAVDDDLATEWSSSGDGDDAWIRIDLGSSQSVTGFQFVTRSMTDGTATTETYTVVVDGGERLGPFPGGNPADPRTAEVSTTGRVFTFEVESSSGGNTGAVEVRVLGD